MSLKDAIFTYLSQELLVADSDRFDEEDIEEMTSNIMNLVERFYPPPSGLEFRDLY